MRPATTQCLHWCVNLRLKNWHRKETWTILAYLPKAACANATALTLHRSGKISLPDAQTEGDLALNFDNVYAPKPGDQSALIQAGAVTGAPESVKFRGLEPGFQHTLNFIGGRWENPTCRCESSHPKNFLESRSTRRSL